MGAVPPFAMEGVKVTLVPEQIEVADPTIEIVGVTVVEIVAFPVGLFEVGVTVPPPLPDITKPFVVTEASIEFELHARPDFTSTTKNNDSVCVTEPVEVGVVLKVLKVVVAVGFAMV